jgi:hypothetical protein
VKFVITKVVVGTLSKMAVGDVKKRGRGGGYCKEENIKQVTGPAEAKGREKERKERVKKRTNPQQTKAV